MLELTQTIMKPKPTVGPISAKLLALFFSTQLENLVAFAFLIKAKGECHKSSKYERFVINYNVLLFYSKKLHYMNGAILKRLCQLRFQAPRLFHNCHDRLRTIRARYLHP